MSGDHAPPLSGQPPAGASLSPAEIAERQQQAMVQAAMRGSVPRFYSNGISLALTAADINFVMLLNGAPVANVSLAYSTAKQLTLDLQNIINSLERVLGQPIRHTSDISRAIQSITFPSVAD